MSAMTGGFKNPPCVVAVKKTNVSVGRAFRPAVTGSNDDAASGNSKCKIRFYNAARWVAGR
jgi:hypothetical protein